MSELGERLKHAWNAFRGRDHPTKDVNLGIGYGRRPDRTRLMRGADRTILTAIINRIAVDCSAVSVQHVRIDHNGRYIETIESGLNSCLNLEANIDQSGRSFLQDVVISMMDEGCVAIVPTDTTIDPAVSTSYDIRSLRTGKIISWYPEHVLVRLYDEHDGQKKDIILPKKTVAIVENPLYAVINEPNSTFQRLIRKLSLLDSVDEQASAGKLDMIIQLPYAVKSDLRLQQAEKRRKMLEDQLRDTKYGIGYIDSTEKITQLNRSIENNLMEQIEYLTSLLYSQLGLTEEVFNGTANEEVMLNYNNRTIEPILSAIADEMKRKFLTKTARSQNQSIMFFRDPFKLSPIRNLADIADRFTRNEILSSNEVRAILGYKPADDPRADELVNKNMPREDTGIPQPMAEQQEVPQEEYYDPESMNEVVDQVEIPEYYYQ